MTPASDFPPLPRPDTVRGTPRRTGIEIEFSGPDVAATCRIIEDTLGGETRSDGDFAATVEGTQLGALEVELDTALRKKADNALVKAGLELAQAVVPVEIITEPLLHADLPRLSPLTDALHAAGAEGSRSHLLNGFGVHLNPETTGDTAHTLAVVRAYALVEDLLRQREGIDMTRRALPFVNPWPDDFVRALIEDRPATLADLTRITARHIDSRNHGLDLFPLIKEAEPEVFDAEFPEDKTKSRPAYHFRLPECRVDEAGWSLAQAWALWHTVERVAETEDLLGTLAAEWLATHRGWPGIARQDWATRADAIIAGSDDEVRA